MKNWNYLRQLVLCLVLISSVSVNASSVQTNLISTPGAIENNNEVSSALEDTLINIVQWSVALGGNDHWYAIVPIVQDWLDHKALAETLVLSTDSGYLVTINSVEENQFIIDNILTGNTDQPSITDEFYLGGRTTDGWLTGEAMDYTNWSIGEPNGDGYAMAIWGASQGSKSGTWNDVPPDDIVGDIHRLWSIVEFGTTNPVQADTLINLVQWPISAGGNDHWYGVLPVEHFWEDANAIANTFEHNTELGHLATIASQEENDFVSANVILDMPEPHIGIVNQSWIGGNDVASNGIWSWVTNEQFQYTNWAAGEPTNPGIETALAMKGSTDPEAGRWNNALQNDSIHDLHQYWSIVEFGVDSGSVVDPMQGAITLDNVIGSPNPGEIYANTDVIFQLRFENNSGSKIAGVSNGFRVYSPDGAGWTTTIGDTIGTVGLSNFDLVFAINSFSVTGYFADSIYFGGAIIVGDGLPDGFNEVAYEIAIGPIDESHVGKTICLDSTYTPPTGNWKWAAIGDNFYPTWDGPHCFTVVTSVEPTGNDGVITLDNVIGSPNSGEIYANTDVKFQIRVNNNTGIEIPGISNGFKVFSPDGAEWGTTTGDTIGSIGLSMFDIVFVINSFSVTGSGIDSIYFGGASIFTSGLPIGYNEIAYEIGIGPIDVNYIGKTICLDSSYAPPSGTWKWAATAISFYPSWDGPHCFTIVPENNPNNGAITLENVIGSPNSGEIYTNTEVKFQLGVLNNTGLDIAGIANGFRVYSPNGAEWTTTVGDTIGSIGFGMFDLVSVINYIGVTGSGADSLTFSSVVMFNDGLPIGFDEVPYEITIGPIDDSHVGKTICLDSSFVPPTGTWKWAAFGSINFFPTWDGPHCFTVVPGVVTSFADSLIIPSMDVGYSTNTLTVECKLEQPIKGATIPIKIPADIDVIELNTTGLITDSWDYNILQIKPDSGFILVALANSFGAEIPVGTNELFNIVFTGNNSSCDAPLQINLDTALSADVTRRLTFVSSSNTSIHPGFDKYRNSLIVPPLLMGDLNDNGATDISDLVFLIDFIFLAGVAPTNMVVADINADCQGPDISDLVSLIDFIFIDNSPISCGCIGTSAKPSIETNHDINIYSEYIDGYTIISVNTPISLKGIELQIENNSNALLEKLPQNELDLYYHTDNKKTKAGLFDAKGLISIQSGKTQLLSIAGDCRIVSVVVADENAHSIIPAINNKISLLPSQFSLLQNYPNPFNPTTNITFGLPVGSQIKLSIYNIQGQKIATVADGYYEAGEHSVVWNGDSFSSGIYLYRLEAGSFVSTKKMMLIK